MGNVNAAGIWTPDEGDSLDPEVWSATMADSIMNGIGERLIRQELPIGLKASIQTGTRVKFMDGVIAPYEILGNGTGCFTSNIDFTGGIATIPEDGDGMYLITAASALAYWGAGPDSAPENETRSIALQIKRNGTDLSGCEVEASEKVWQTAQANTVVICVPGDQISVNWYSAGPVSGPGDTGAMIADNPALHSLSIVLITPIPPA